MTFEQVAAMIDEVGIPAAYYQFPETGQKPPFICFFFSGSNDFIADDCNYKKIERLNIELYTTKKDFALEERVETVLYEHGMVWSREETYIDSEKLYEVIYELDVLIEKEGE